MNKKLGIYICGSQTSTDVGLLRVIVFALFIFFSANTASAAVINKPTNLLGMVGYWTFDGPDMTSNVRDKSGNGNNANLQAFTATTTVSGKIGQALDFNGTSNYVSTQTQFSNPQTYTISVWFKTVVAGGKIIGFEDVQTGTAATSYDRHLYIGTDGKVYFGWYPGTVAVVASGAVLTDGQWHHAIGTHDGTTGTLYIDGVSQGTNTGASQAYSGYWRIGSYKATSWTNGADGYFKGSIDDVRAYNRSLSANEVKVLYNSSSAKFGVAKAQGALANGLVGWWTMDGGDTPWTSANTATTIDKSGNGNTGTLTNMNVSTSTIVGKVGQALKFNGVNSHIAIPNSASLNNWSEQSISFWFKMARPMSQYSRIVEKGYNNEWTIIANVNGSATGYPVTFQNLGNSGTLFTSTNNFDDGQWHHIVATINSTYFVRMYVDGVFDKQAQSSFASTKTHDITIGKAGTGNTETFNGLIDDVRIYNRALSVSEVSALYNSGGSKIAATPAGVAGQGLNSGLVGWWTMDGKDTVWTSATVGTVVDKSGNGNTGTLTGMNIATAPTAGKIGQALNFKSVSDYIILSNPSSFPIITPWTASVWVKPNNFSNIYVAMFWGENSVNGPHIAIPGSNVWRVGIWGSVSCDGGTVDINQWQLVTGTFDGVNLRLYKNGSLVGIPCAASPLVSASPTAAVGANDGSYLFNGILDDARIYSRALSASEIQRLYNSGR